MLYHNIFVIEMSIFIIQYHRRCIVIYLTRDELPFYTRHYSEYTIVNATSWLVDRLSRFISCTSASNLLICQTNTSKQWAKKVRRNRMNNANILTKITNPTLEIDNQNMPRHSIQSSHLEWRDCLLQCANNIKITKLLPSKRCQRI